MEEQERTTSINRLMTAVIQEQDIENATRALNRIGITVTRLPSVGGFLARRNATLLIGFNAGQEKATVDALSKSCRRRVEYIATPLEGSPLPFPSPTPIMVGGATIFTLDIEKFVEY